jgi:hypothetical protein
MIPAMTAKEVFEVAAAVIASLGGGGVIVFALSGYLGKRWADRALEKQKQEYAQLNIAFTNQLDIATRRLQVALDTQGLFQRLRIESEFDRVKKLWRRVVILKDAFWLIPKSGFAFVNPDKEKQHEFHLKASSDFATRFQEAYNFWSKETLSIPKNIADLTQELLKVAQEEVIQAIQYPDPFYGNSLVMFNDEARVKFFDDRNKNATAFDALTKQLERMMREYIEGGWNGATPNNKASPGA